MAEAASIAALLVIVAAGWPPLTTSLVVTSSSDTTTTACPIAFEAIGGRCYFFGSFRLNWFRAMEFCHSFGQSVSLAAIETRQENMHLKEWLSQHGDPTTGVWIGGSDNGHAGKWAWFPTGQLIRGLNWGPSQPSGGDQHCLYMVGGFLDYRWADFHCDFEMTFLCEHQVNAQTAWRRKRKLTKKHAAASRLRFPNATAEYMADLHRRIECFKDGGDGEDDLEGETLFENELNSKFDAGKDAAGESVAENAIDLKDTLSLRDKDTQADETGALVNNGDFESNVISANDNMAASHHVKDEKSADDLESETWSILNMIKSSIANRIG